MRVRVRVLLARSVSNGSVTITQRPIRNPVCVCVSSVWLIDQNRTLSDQLIDVTRAMRLLVKAKTCLKFL